jgi:sialate O-acetylesterase
MKSVTHFSRVMLVITFLATLCSAQDAAPTAKLKVHSIFASNMVIQRDKPVVVWGWAQPGQTVTVQFGEEKAEAEAAGDKGRWEVTFPARKASAEPRSMVVAAGGEKVEYFNIVVGDVWVMNGQSNMAFALDKVQEADMEAAQAHLPLLRFFSIDPNEQSTLHEDIPAEKIRTQGWAVSDPKTARDFSAIGYVFGARLQRALQIPIGVIKNARGGASIESLVPRFKFAEDPLAKRYADFVEEKIAAFDAEAESLKVWNNQLNRAKSQKKPEKDWPKKPVNADNLTSWNIPGKSPSDMASCYNGMFGVFKGYNIKGVVFHQGFNNALSSNCRPKRYRVLMRLMVQGWREDFKDPALPVCVVGFCAGGDTQHAENFEPEGTAGAPFIRESQRLGLADVGDPVNTAFLSGDDVQVPGLHPAKKREHGERAARWALSQIYKTDIKWDTARLVSAEPQGDMMVLKFDKSVMPDDWSPIVEGFAIAGGDGRYFMAHARFLLLPGKKPGGNARNHDTTIVRVWSPLVKEPKAVRYSWATSPMGNLKVDGKPWQPLHSFRTDNWDYPESEDPAVVPGAESKQATAAAAAALCEERRTKEAATAGEILERLKTLTIPVEKPEKPTP